MSNDNPYSEAWFKTLKFAPVFPERFGTLDEAGPFMSRFVEDRTTPTTTAASA